MEATAPINLSVFTEGLRRIGRIIQYILESGDTQENVEKVFSLAETVLIEEKERKALEVVRNFVKDHGQLPTLSFVIEESKATIQYPVGPSCTFPEAIELIRKEQDTRRRSRIAGDLVGIAERIQTIPSEEIYGKIQKSLEPFNEKEEFKDDTAHTLYLTRKNRPAGLLTFIPPVDEKIRGVEPGTVMSICAYVSSFKSQACVSMLYGNVTSLKYNCAYVTLEVPKDHVKFMLVARHSYHPKFQGQGVPVDWIRVAKAELTEEEERFLFDVVEPDLLGNAEHGKFIVLDECDFETMHPEAIRRRLMSLPVEIDALFVDYIQLFQFVEHDSRYARVNEPANHYVRAFAQMALDFGGRRIAVVLAAQTNSEGFKRAEENNGTYDMRAIANLNEIPRSSYYCLFLYTDDSLRSLNNIKVQLLKHRGGPLLSEPVVVFADPRYVVVGSEIEGFTSENTSDLSSFLVGGSND
jgi:hypothetical protein